MARLDLGAGLVVFPDLVPLLDEIGDRADVYELEPQTCWLPTGDPDRPWRIDREVFAAIAGRHRPVLAHGVSAPVGGTEPPDPRAVALFAESVDALGAVAASEHLAFNRAVVDGSTIETGLFLPPCPSDALVELAVGSVATYQRHLSVPFSIENAVSYLRPRPGELADSTIVARVAEGADCGILLDLHNLWCNERNGRETVDDALARLPLERVTEVHLAGGQWLGGCYLDAHSGPVDPALMAIAARVLPMLPEVRAVLFEILPSRLWGVGLDPLLAQLEALQDLVTDARRAARRRSPTEQPTVEEPDADGPTARRRRHARPVTDRLGGGPGGRGRRRRRSHDHDRRPGRAGPARARRRRPAGPRQRRRARRRSGCCSCRAPTTSTASSTTTAAPGRLASGATTKACSCSRGSRHRTYRSPDWATPCDSTWPHCGSRSTARPSRSCWTGIRIDCSPRWPPVTSRPRRPADAGHGRLSDRRH